jgi:hypothetical protein
MVACHNPRSLQEELQISLIPAIPYTVTSGGGSMNGSFIQVEEAIVRQRKCVTFSGIASMRQGMTILFERAYGGALREESIPMVWILVFKSLPAANSSPT